MVGVETVRSCLRYRSNVVEVDYTSYATVAFVCLKPARCNTFQAPNTWIIIKINVIRSGRCKWHEDFHTVHLRGTCRWAALLV